MKPACLYGVLLKEELQAVRVQNRKLKCTNFLRVLLTLTHLIENLFPRGIKRSRIEWSLPPYLLYTPRFDV